MLTRLGWDTHHITHPPPSPLGPQVVLLDPVQYPGAIKVFAREVCRNDILNFGRMHFFFPDSRLALDLNTDKTLKVCVAWWGGPGVAASQCKLQPRHSTSPATRRSRWGKEFVGGAIPAC